MIMLKLIEATPIAPYRLQLRFNDGRSGMADLHDLVASPNAHAFAGLREPGAFAQCHIEQGVLNWTGELDLAPEYLYFLAFRNDPLLAPQFKTWGYL